jgi:hypothetical protein
MHQSLPYAIAVSTQDVCLTLSTLLCQPKIQGFQRRKPWDGLHEVTACKGDQALNSTFVIALAWAAIAVMNEVMRQ